MFDIEVAYGQSDIDVGDLSIWLQQCACLSMRLSFSCCCRGGGGAYRYATDAGKWLPREMYHLMLPYARIHL